MADNEFAYPWQNAEILRGKTIVVTGCASGIGFEAARVVRMLGGHVIGVDINESREHVDEFHQADLSDKSAIEALVENLPKGSHGIANIAGLPPTRPPVAVLKVNLLGLKYFTELMVPGLADGAAIVNLASLAGSGWRQSLTEIKAAADLDFDGVAEFVRRHGIGSEGGRSYFFSKEALAVWTMQNRWTWRSRGIRMNAVSPGPVETPILPDFLATLGARAEEDMRIMDRPGRPEDVAPVVAFLLSDMSAWIRGANIPCDGGMESHLILGHVP